MVAELENQFLAITAVFTDIYRDILSVWLIWLSITITTPTELNSQGFMKTLQMILILPA